MRSRPRKALLAAAGGSLVVACSIGVHVNGATASSVGGAALKRCDSHRGRTLAKSFVARIFERHVSSGTQVVGCSYRTRKIVAVFPGAGDDGGLCGTLGPMRLAGAMVAYSFDSCGGGGTYYRDFVEVRDVRSGRRVHRTNSPPDEYVTTTSIVVKGNGSVGWIWRDQGAADGAGDPLCSYAVMKLVRGRRTRLDSGCDIDGSSLSLRGSTVSWMKGGKRRAATLR